MAKLKKEKRSEVPGALYHPEVGEIDLIWGNAGTKAMNYEDGSDSPRSSRSTPRWPMTSRACSEQLRVNRTRSGPNRTWLEGSNREAAVRLEWDGVRKKWLLTAYEKSKP